MPGPQKYANNSLFMGLGPLVYLLWGVQVDPESRYPEARTSTLNWKPEILKP